MATINNILQLSETHPRLVKAQYRALNSTDNVEVSTHGRCSSSDSPQWKEADKAHLVASVYSGVQEQATTSLRHQQEVELLKLPSSQHLAHAGMAAHKRQQQEQQQEHLLPVLHGQQLHAAGCDDGHDPSVGPPGLTGQFSGDSASSMSTRNALASPDATPGAHGGSPGKGAASPAGNAVQPQQQAQPLPAADGHLPGSPVAAEEHREQESLSQRASSQQLVLDVEGDAAGAAGAMAVLHSAASTSTVFSVLGDNDPMSQASTPLFSAAPASLVTPQLQAYLAAVHEHRQMLWQLLVSTALSLRAQAVFSQSSCWGCGMEYRANSTHACCCRRLQCLMKPCISLRQLSLTKRMRDSGCCLPMARSPLCLSGSGSGTGRSWCAWQALPSSRW